MLAFLTAHAAEIQVITETPVVVEVDGRTVSARGGERGTLATGLAGGAHKVQVYDLQDRLLAATVIELRVEEQVRVELRRGALAELGRGPLAASLPAAPAAPGTFQLTGLDPTSVAVWIDGQPVSWSNGGFVARNLAVGAHDLRVVRVEALAPTAATAPKAGPTPIDERDLAGIVAAVKAENFSSDQLGMLKSAARDRWFTAAQVGVLLDVYAHASDKVEAARVLAPRVVDPENAWKLDAHLTFSRDKEAVRALFTR